MLAVASQPEDFCDGGLTFVSVGTIIVISGVFGVLIVCDILESLIRRDVRDMVARDDADELVDFVRVSRVVIVLLVVLLWGWSPSSLGSDDPGDRSLDSSYEGLRGAAMSHPAGRSDLPGRWSVG